MADTKSNVLTERASSVDGGADSAVTLQGGYSSTARGLRDAGAALLVDFYTRVYPSVDELAVDLDDLEEGELAEIVGELRTEVEVLQEETTMFEHQVAQVQSRGNTNNAGANNNNNNNNNNNTQGNAAAAIANIVGGGGADVPSAYLEEETVAVSASGPAAAASTRRGKGYRRKSQGDNEFFVPVADKIAMLGKEEERLQLQEEHATRQASLVKDLLTATVEESQRRLKELRLEFRQFCREVLKNDGKEDKAGGGMTDAVELADGTISIQGSACADDLLVYMRRRVQSQNNYLDKLNVQCVAAQEDIARAQQQVRQRKAAGEAFNAVDFAQLKIENDQFNERIDTKNAELADLKGTSTRAVQTLNSLVDSLNDLNAEQTQLKKELKSRGEYLMRCAKEVTVVATEATAAEKKNQAIKAQHEAVKVPKIEEYIAQTAELFELQKALKNWSRKVEIAEGQVKVLRQQTKTLSSQREAAVAYAEGKKKRQAVLVSTRRVTPTTGFGSVSSNSKGNNNKNNNAVVVGGEKSLLQSKRGTAASVIKKGKAAAASSAADGAASTVATGAAGSNSNKNQSKSSPTDKSKASADEADGKSAAMPTHENEKTEEETVAAAETETETATAEAVGIASEHSPANEDISNHHLRAVAPTVAPASPVRHQPTSSSSSAAAPTSAGLP